MTKPTRILVLASLFLVGACGSAPHDAAASVPLGSALADLDRHFIRGADSEGEVVEWIPQADGTRTEKALGDYDAWKATPDVHRFTGTITFFHHGTTSADVNELTYEKGRLKKKDWGFLPG